MRRIDLTRAELASSETARRINRDILLEIIRARQPISRADLARVSGLQRSTVSQIIEQLIEELWIREGAVARLPRGRRPTMLVLNEDVVVLTADLHPRKAAIAVIDLNGRVLSHAELSLSHDPAKVATAILECMRRLRQAHPEKSFRGVGVSLPGRVDSQTQRLIFAPNLHWPDFDLRQALAKGLRMPVEMENAANACLTSELWFGRMQGVQNAVLITVSEGIGGGILANGQLVTGQNGMAGEFGHISLDPRGPRCGCGQRGCWETFASCKAALRHYQESSGASRRIAYQDLLALGAEKNPHAVGALTEQARQIGRGLRLVIASLSPELVLIAGEVTSAWNLVAPALRKEMEAQWLGGTMPRIEPTFDSDAARLRGAAAMLLQRRASAIDRNGKVKTKPKPRT
ncbi:MULTISPECIES: ROK family protein [Acidobacterium]|uniref:ROK family protein n=1 Tax=Acidobacterium capsulatum (strain ATCC 51196 / DSM 11244 / BCRC 80197 / JCM 7670 / NBRC 15755 / NCIMB 13165 / 161) TaxID=240015 RepID=C1F498_ACIC5|nr:MULTISPECIES: ROK family protein [Acidobacterium]ACO33698.1 ROK family protein [Acidobacterium capsulatum ATCC 51196]HCT60352.1 sugar kinase [Acidobacterium sp.]